MAKNPRRTAAHISTEEVPSQEIVEKLIEAALLGLNPSMAAAYAEVSATLVKNWLVRGFKEEHEPFDLHKYNDEDVKACHSKFHKDVTVPCYALWMSWQKARSRFVMKCVKKLAVSRTWQAQAWLLERLEPSTFVRPGTPGAIRRELLPYEKEVESAVVTEDVREVVQIILPSNGR